MLKKRFSQNLIKDGNVLDKMVRVMDVTAGDRIIEIGPGQGDLTARLCAKAGRVVAIEIDRAFEDELRGLEARYPHLTVVFADVLTVDLGRFLEAPVRVVGNIPYHITGPILFAVVGMRRMVSDAFFTMQKEVAERIVSPYGRKSYGSLSVVFQLLGHPKIHFSLHPQIFTPPPKVESAFLGVPLTDEGRSRDDGMMPFIRRCFETKRKYLRHTMVKYYGREHTDELYGAFGFSPAVRAEELPPPVFADLFLWFWERGLT